MPFPPLSLEIQPCKTHYRRRPHLITSPYRCHSHVAKHEVFITVTTRLCVAVAVPTSNSFAVVGGRGFSCYRR